MEYLGHRISKEGVSKVPEYVQKIKKWPLPKTGKEVAKFLGFSGFYRRFILQYSALTKRLNRIKKVEKFVWNEEMWKWKKWKHILSYCLFAVHTDASTLKYLTTMKNQSGLFMRGYQDLATLH